MSIEDDIGRILYGHQPPPAARTVSPPHPPLEDMALKLEETRVTHDCKAVRDFQQVVDYALYLEKLNAIQADEIAELKASR